MLHNKDHKKWSNIEITHEDTDIDYYVIINYPLDDAVYEASKTIVFQMEPWVYDETKRWGVKTWGNKWSAPDPTKFLKVFTHKTHLNNVQWQIDYPFHSTPVTDGTKKLNKVATICSSKNFDEGHLLRNTFIRYCEQQYMNNIDVFGKDNFHNFNTLYKGPVPDENKYNVYSNYKYCLGVENNSEHNYATEKLWEAILCESLCFYWGCPNIEEYIDEKAFVRLPLEDPKAALQIIQQAMAEDWWTQRIEVIKQMKKIILNELGFFPLLNKLINKTLTDTTTSKLSNIKSLVLTLPEYSSRLPKLDELLKKFETIGLNPELFNGVHGKDIVMIDNDNDNDNKSVMETIVWRDITYQYNKNIRLNGQRMLPGEFGCLWSHVNIFKDLLKLDGDSNDSYLVIEDDAELVKPIDELHNLLLHLPEDMDFCHLAYSQWYPFLLTKQRNDYFYECEKRFFNGCVAYVVSKKGAKKILDYIGNEFNMPIDDFINTIYRTQPDFKFYVPKTFFFKEQDDTVSIKLNV